MCMYCLFILILFSKSNIFFFLFIYFFFLYLLHFDRSITLYAKNIIEWYSYSTSIARLYVYIISWHLKSERKLVYHHPFKNEAYSYSSIIVNGNFSK